MESVYKEQSPVSRIGSNHFSKEIMECDVRVEKIHIREMDSRLLGDPVISQSFEGAARKKADVSGRSQEVHPFQFPNQSLLPWFVLIQDQGVDLDPEGLPDEVTEQEVHPAVGASQIQKDGSIPPEQVQAPQFLYDECELPKISGLAIPF